MANYRQMLVTIGNDIEALMKRINRHAHSPAKVYPTLAVGKSVQAAATAWTLGNFAEIIPANTIDGPFDIHFLNIEASPTSDIFEIVLYKGLSGEEEEVGRIRTIPPSATYSISLSMPFQMDIVPKGTRISAKVASSLTTSPTVTFSVQYHTY